MIKALFNKFVKMQLTSEQMFTKIDMLDKDVRNHVAYNDSLPVNFPVFIYPVLISWIYLRVQVIPGSTGAKYNNYE